MERLKQKNRYFEAVKSLLISGYVFRPDHEYRDIAATILRMIHRGKFNSEIQDELYWRHDIPFHGGANSTVHQKKEIFSVFRIIHAEKILMR